VSLGLPCFLLLGGRHFINYFGNLPSSILNQIIKSMKKFNSNTYVHWEWKIIQIAKMSKLAPDNRINSEIETVLFVSIPRFRTFGHWRTFGGRETGAGAVGLHLPKAEFKNTNFVDMIIPKVLRDFRFSLNHPKKSAEHQYVGILKNIIKTDEYVDIFFQSDLISPVS
jgi:hypothetical protein